ncbi:hypothetical protein NG798_05270 [Ancylothrix sp. C2]|uniref:salt stress protein, Slr1339 family n=1 Tax=Ancylothrix sp. D3o TaxID=2953691 RepID=UPI0021BA407F|nr:hypothetical protein [Ancylothrix sp. D3o]MCT7949191.1 hypothetical protein [Ancylothrix sp. D3o]
MESIDDLLAELKAEYQPEKPPALPKQAQKPVIPQIPTVPVKTSAGKPSQTDFLLQQIKAEYEEQEKAEELKKQEEIKQEQIKQQQLIAQQKKGLKKPAEEWLKKLDPLSEEGLWFEEFAYKYPSKLEAAIDYLQALQGS